MTGSKIQQALDELRAGRFVVVVDDESREREADLVLAAQHATPAAINFMAREACGLICVAMHGRRMDQLGIPPMVSPENNTSAHGTAFGVPVDAASGITTGISAYDRAHTIRLLADPSSTPGDFIMPGHVFPLRAREGGVLERRGHTEAAVDLMVMAELQPVAAICEIMAPNGRMVWGEELEEFAHRHNLMLVTVQEVADARAAESEGTLGKVRPVKLPTSHGEFTLVAYTAPDSREPHLALIHGDPGSSPLVRLHSECFTGDVLGSERCDCGPQLDRALQMIAAQGGILLYLRQEGRGIGLLNKLRAYALQDEGLDTVEANEHLGFQPDERDYAVAAEILRDLGVSSVRLLTNNPRKIEGLRAHGIEVVERVPLEVPPRRHNLRYLQTKKLKLGHWLQLHPPIGEQR